MQSNRRFELRTPEPAAWRTGVRAVTIGLALVLQAGRAAGQAGPPFLTNDPGTPGNASWEIK